MSYGQRGSKVDVVPKDLNEMVRLYHPFVSGVIQRYNKVPGNYEDLVQHTFLELVRVDVVSKYMRSGSSLPDQLSGEQAASYVGCTFAEFRKAVGRSQVGTAPRLRRGFTSDQVASVFRRDRGVCATCQCNTESFRKGLERVRLKDPLKYRAMRAALLGKFGLGPLVRTFWGPVRIPGKVKGRSGVGDLETRCFRCTYKALMESTGLVRQGVGQAPTPMDGPYTDPGTLYTLSDVEAFKVYRETHGVERSPDAAPFTLTKRSGFQAYLGLAVKNIYANWCRTRHRRYKEVYCAPQEDGQSWEGAVEDSTLISPDALIDVTRRVDRAVQEIAESGAHKRIPVSIDPDQVRSLMSQGYTVGEASKILLGGRRSLVQHTGI